ncbi:MAG: uncharacterized membrane protein YcjF (UPF0283 family) [Paraglaciecola sp.]
MRHYILETVLSEPNYHRYSPIYRLAYWLGAIFIIALGVYLTRTDFMQTEWLTRAGCLVVMLGVWSGIGGVFQERLLHRRSKWRRRKALAAAKGRLHKEKAPPEELEKKLTAINESFDNQMADAAHILRLSVGVLEVSLLMTGTFLWGFGDFILR